MRRMEIKQFRTKLKEVRNKLKLTREDFQFMAGIIVSDRKRLMDAGLRIDNEQAQTPLKQKTIDRKSGKHKTIRFSKKKGGLYSSRAKVSATPSTPLVDTGIMKTTAPIQLTAKSARIPIARSRKTIGAYHQSGGGHLPQRPHWGISPTAKRKIDAFLEARIKRILKEIT